MRKYGFDQFKIEPIDTSPTNDQMLIESEIAHIAKLSPHYNMTTGGEGGDTSNSPNYIEGMKQRRKYVGSGNPNFGKRGKDSPKFGKKYGPKPNISAAKKQPVMADGICFPSIGDCERSLKIKWHYSSNKYPERFYRL